MSDLTDFGMDDDRNIDEEYVKNELTNWIESPKNTVYWEKENEYNHSTFSTSGTDRPDILVKNEVYGKIRYWAIEVKQGVDSGQIHRGAAQLYRYLKKYENGDEYYKIEGEDVDITGFLLASKYSFMGKLYHNYGNRDILHEKTWASENDYISQPSFLPNKEYAATESLVRILWQFANDLKNDDASGIGALLSGILDDEPPEKYEHANDPKSDLKPFEYRKSVNPYALYYDLSAESKMEQNWEVIQ